MGPLLQSSQGLFKGGHGGGVVLRMWLIKNLRDDSWYNREFTNGLQRLQFNSNPLIERLKLKGYSKFNSHPYSEVSLNGYSKFDSHHRTLRATISIIHISRTERLNLKGYSKFSSRPVQRG